MGGDSSFMLRDIGEKSLIKATEEAERDPKANSQFLVNKSHEIRTYMTRIISMTDLTLMTEVTEEQRDYLTIVKSSTRSLLKVLNDILDSSKIQAGKVDLEQAPFHIRATIHEVVHLFHVAAKQKNVYIRLNRIDNRIPKNLIGDSVRLKQVLSSIVGNGVKFTDQSEVTINVDLVEQDERSIKLKFIVSDIGIGIPEEKLVKLMAGDLFVNSSEGLGNEFWFTAKFGVQDSSQENWT